MGNYISYGELQIAAPEVTELAERLYLFNPEVHRHDGSVADFAEVFDTVSAWFGSKAGIAVMQAVAVLYPVASIKDIHVAFSEGKAIYAFVDAGSSLVSRLQLNSWLNSLDETGSVKPESVYKYRNANLTPALDIEDDVFEVSYADLQVIVTGSTAEVRDIIVRIVNSEPVSEDKLPVQLQGSVADDEVIGVAANENGEFEISNDAKAIIHAMEAAIQKATSRISNSIVGD